MKRLKWCDAEGCGDKEDSLVLDSLDLFKLFLECLACPEGMAIGRDREAGRLVCYPPRSEVGTPD
jgi:hypothetical protein